MKLNVNIPAIYSIFGKLVPISGAQVATVKMLTEIEKYFH